LKNFGLILQLTILRKIIDSYLIIRIELFQELIFFKYPLGLKVNKNFSWELSISKSL